MTDYLHLSPTPIDEPCQQVGPNYDPQRARAECRAFINQLKRQFPAETALVTLSIKNQQHDFGSYVDVIATFDSENESAVDAAYTLEGSLPENWDDEAKKELDNNGA
jgi:hypothetical protein